MPGMNIDASFIGNRGKLVQWTREHQPDAHTLIDDYKQGYSLSHELHDASPSTLIVHRQYDPHGENTPDYLNRVQFNAPDFEIYNIANEPDLQGAGLAYTLSYLVMAAHLGASKNKPMCLGNFSTGSWQQGDIDKGFYDEYLTVLSTYHDLHYMGLHQYKLVRLPYFFNNGRVPKDLVDPAKGGDEYDVTPAQFVRDSFTNFHLGRDLWFDTRCQQLGIREPRKIFTEYLYDRNRDELEHVPEIDNFAERQVSGVDTLAKYYQKVQPGRSWEQSVAHQIEHMETCFSPNVVGKCIYAWSLQSEWTSYDVSRHDKLLELLPKGTPVTTNTTAFPPDDAPGWDTAVTTESSVRVREKPSLSGRVLMGLPKGTQLPANFDAKWLANDFRPVLFTQGRVHGYIHKDYLKRVEETPVFDTTAALETLGRIAVLNDAMIIHQNEMDTLMVEKTAKINELRTILEGLD